MAFAIVHSFYFRFLAWSRQRYQVREMFPNLEGSSVCRGSCVFSGLCWQRSIPAGRALRAGGAAQPGGDCHLLGLAWQLQGWDGTWGLEWHLGPGWHPGPGCARVLPLSLGRMERPRQRSEPPALQPGRRRWLLLDKLCK